MSIQAMKQALEALENYTNVVSSVNDPTTWTPKIKDEGSPAREAITALRSAIAEAEKCEPVAEVTQEDINQIVWLVPSLGVGRGSKLYTHPQPAIPADWQPIETAPRDGTDVLIYTMAGSMYVAGYDDAFSNVWRIRNDEGVNARVVTHWMPLPAAPKPENSHD